MVRGWLSPDSFLLSGFSGALKAPRFFRSVIRDVTSATLLLGVRPRGTIAAMVPHLTTALAGPLQDLERRILDRMPEIERWLRTQWQEHAVPFYASVDLRNAGFKLAPVDTNLFPGGFNNLNPSFAARACRRSRRRSSACAPTRAACC